MGRDSMVIAPKQCLEGFYIPTAFTPGKDGANGIFKPKILERVTKYQFQIYNRWGMAMFQTTDIDKGWNGQYSGIIQGSNVYVWLCTYQIDGGPVEQKKGTVILIR
jgi:gliding motility-associated-like protein